MLILLAAVCAFVLTVLFGRIAIPMLRALKAGQSIREIGPKWHNSKAGTPTMGGIMFILASLICTVAFGWKDMLEGEYTHLLVFAFALVYGLIGFADDFIKVKLKRNLGLTAAQKFLLQLAAAVAYLLLLRHNGNLTCDLYIPFWNVTFQINWVVYLIFAVLVIVGCVNAVNLTDGIDGLASGVTLPVMVFFAVFAYMWGTNSGSAALALLPALAMAQEAAVMSGGTGHHRGRTCGLPVLQLPSGKGLYGRYRLPVPRSRRVRHGVRAGYAVGADPCRPCLHSGNALRHDPGDLFQAHPRQALLQNDADPPPF